MVVVEGVAGVGVRGDDVGGNGCQKRLLILCSVQTAKPTAAVAGE